MNNTTGNGTIILFELYSSMAQIIGYSLAYGILGSLALAGEYIFPNLSKIYIRIIHTIGIWLCLSSTIYATIVLVKAP